MSRKDLQIELEKLKHDINILEKNNKILYERAVRHESQFARNKITNNTESGCDLHTRFFNLKLIDYMETAISIFSYDGLPENFRNNLNSKRIETQIASYGKVALFPHEYVYQDSNGKNKKEKTYYLLPFVGVSGTLDCYGEFQVVKPYSPISANYDFKELVVNEDCVIFSDFFQFSQTNANLSYSIKDAFMLYCELIADCEIIKKINRNWISLPLVFSGDMQTNTKEFNAFVTEVQEFMQSIKNRDNAIITNLIKNLVVTPTSIQYFGAELEQTIIDYENALRNYIGLGIIKNETRERKITAEFEKTSDQYNINVTKRLQLREQAIKIAKDLWIDDFKNVKIKINLDGYNKAKGVVEQNDKDSNRNNDNM